MNNRRFCAAAAALGMALSAPAAAQSAPELPDGWLLWHSYSSYDARDSRLFLRAPDGEICEITGNFIHAMNGSFGSSPDRITFMAIDPAADEWDIFLSDGGTITNLTQRSGYRNEDPKWSPDGSSIVFKRGHWDSGIGDFRYDLALLDLRSGAVTMLTDDRTEEAMPCFSPDGAYLYYAAYSGGIGAIMRMDMQTRETETVFSESGVSAYYPIAYADGVYFTKWHSAENRHDQIMRYDGAAITALPFNSEEYDCSDACPAGDGMIYSSTQSGGYDLYCFDGTEAVPLTARSSAQNDLGAAFCAAVRGDITADGRCSPADAAALQKWLLTESDALPDWRAGDLNADGRLNAADLTLLKRALIG